MECCRPRRSARAPAQHTWPAREPVAPAGSRACAIPPCAPRRCSLLEGCSGRGASPRIACLRTRSQDRAVWNGQDAEHTLTGIDRIRSAQRTNLVGLWLVPRAKGVRLQLLPRDADLCVVPGAGGYSGVGCTCTCHVGGDVDPKAVNGRTRKVWCDGVGGSRKRGGRRELDSPWTWASC